MAGSPLLWVIAGPNGAGKTTYWERFVRPRLDVPFVNADVIARDRGWGSSAPEAYAAAQLAEERRAAFLVARASFVAETVFSHPSKLELIRAARTAAYTVWLTFIGLERPEVAIARVASRVRAGGHPVPDDKVAARYARAMAMVSDAVPLVQRLFVIDNSEADTALRSVARFDHAELAWCCPAERVPTWAREALPVLGS